MQPSTTLVPRLLQQSPQKKNTNTRILLVETNNNSNSSPYQQRYERYTLQEVVNTSPTYYGTSTLSPRSSIASTVSTRSDLSSLSQSTSFSPPSSPITENDPSLSASTRPSRRSWTNSMDKCSGSHTSLMIRSTLPLGWLRPSLSPIALLDQNFTGHPSHFVFLGFGRTDTLMNIFGLNGPVPLDGNGISERSFFLQMEDAQQVMCTLVTIPSDDDGAAGGSPYLENLTLNRIGVTSILLALPVHSTGNDIMRQLGQINKAMAGIDPQSTWWERLILLLYHDDDFSCTDLFDQRTQLVQTTLPNLMLHLPVLPCITLLGSPTNQARRILYEQACMHQTDHGWWHGSTIPIEDTSDSSDDDDGLLLPVAIMIGNKSVTAKKKPLFTVDTPTPGPPPPPPTHHHDNPPPSYSFLSNSPPPPSSSPSTNTVNLKHRFSKKWTEAPRRHYSKHSERSTPYH